MKLKERLINWLLPEYGELKQQVYMLNQEMREAMEKPLSEKSLEFGGKLILFGSLHACKIELKPTIEKVEVTLAKFGIESALKVSGSQQTINNSIFTSYDYAIKEMAENDK